MATTLQKQLGALQATTNNELDLKAQRAAHAQSLLFEPAFAASQSFDSIFPICRDGFLELCELDSRFSSYESTLFSHQSKVQDRNILTQTQNEELSRVIEGFLGLVGPSVLLKSAQMAIEWLIRRFRIHELDTESLVMVFLPHHLEPIFTTLLSILPPKLPLSLSNLHSYANARSNPPLDALVNAAVQNSSFLSLINRHVLRTSRSHSHHHALISLWASVITQTIDRLLDGSKSGRREIERQRSQDFLTNLLPVLDQALALGKSSELIIGTHMAIIVLIRKANLDDRALDAIMSAVALSLTNETCETALACLSLIAEQRQSYSLPRIVSKKLSRVENISWHLEILSRHQSIKALAMGLCFGFLERMRRKPSTEAPQLLKVLIKNQLLHHDELQAITTAVRTVLNEEKFNTKSRTRAGDVRTQLQDLATFQVESDDSGAEVAYNGNVGARNESSLDERPPMAFEMAIQAIRDGLAADTDSQPANISTPSRTESFLSPFTLLPFDALADAFELALPLRQQIDQFLGLPLLGRSVCQSNPLFFTFLAKIWSSNRSVSVRNMALKIASEQINQFQRHSVDLQFLIPYLLVGLRDPSRKTRRSAADVVLALSSYTASESESNLAPGTIYGKKTVELKSISPKDEIDLVKRCLEPELEGCVSDPSHLRVVLSACLGNHSATESSSNRHILKADQKAAIFSSLGSHVSLTSCANIKFQLLQLLNGVGKVTGQLRSHFLLPCLRNYLPDFARHAELCKTDGVDLTRLTTEMFDIVHPGDPNALKFLFETAKEDQGSTNSGLQVSAFRRMFTLWSRVRPTDQRSMTTDIFHLALAPGTSQFLKAEAMGFLKSIRVRSDVLTLLIEEVLESQEGKRANPRSKRHRTDGGAEAVYQEGEQHDRNFLAKLTVVVELAGNVKSGANIELFRVLFKVLQDLQNYRMRTESDLGYLTDATLSALSITMRDLNREPEGRRLMAQFVRPDLLVDCVRQTTSSQTRNSASLLLSELARQSPQVILHSVMPIFTMMSATTARLSDDFSAHVVDQTIRDVIPVLVKKLHEQRKNLISATAEIFLSFAASFDHIPPHRRLQLFSLLAGSLGAEDSLFAIIATLSDRFPANSEVLKFASTLFCQFNSSVSIVTILKILDLVKTGLEPSSSLFRVLIQKDNTTGSRESSMRNLMATVQILLKDQSFQVQLQGDLDSGGLVGDKLEQLLRQSFECIFSISIAASMELKPPASLVMEHILSLFPFNVMARSIEPFLRHPDDALCSRMLLTLEKRIRSCQRGNPQTSRVIASLLPRLTPILEGSTRPDLKPKALTCIDQICERFGKVDRSATLAAAHVVAGKFCLGSDDTLLQTLSFHCLASFAEMLGNDFISILNPTENVACSALQTAISRGDENLHNSVYAFLISLLDNIPFMVSQDCLRTVLNLTEECALANFGNEAYESRAQLRKLAGMKMEISTVVRVTLQSWRSSVQRGPVVLCELVELIESLAENHTKSEVIRHNRVIFDLIFEALALRSTTLNLPGLYSSQQIDRLEHSIIEALIVIVLKVNDTIFRPFFAKLVDWSASAEHQGEIRELRSITLFNIISCLSDRLKSIFTSYFGYVLSQARDILRNDASNPVLLKSLLGAITTSFKHDHDDFWLAPSHSDMILQPLVSRLSNPSIQALYPQISLAITELAAAANSLEHHKVLNNLLLRLCRAGNSHTRLAVVKCQQSLTERLGDEWLSNLPEMLPAINELQEDDDESIERETHRWIRLIEGKLGESLNSMLQ